VPEVAVYARPIDGHDASEPATAVATMNQHDLAFEPHLLIVETGTAVEFPNEDEVRHHVYSFSPAKQLNLSIQSHTAHTPERFNEAGVVTLGCNIHDSMLAYILVVDTPYFAKSDDSGLVAIESLPPGSYELTLWTPRLRTRDLPKAMIIEIDDSHSASVELQIDGKLMPPHHASETSLKWDAY
jgi:plastocyanin